MIRVLLADDQDLIRGALAAPLSLKDDIEMPRLTGLQAATRLRGSATRVLILTTFGRPGYLTRAMEAGAYGFLVKDAPAEQLAAAVRTVAAGNRVVDPALAAATLSSGDNPLTGREQDVLRAAAGGSDRGRHRRPSLPVGGNRPQLPVRSDRQDRCPEPRRGGPDGGRQRLAVSGGAAGRPGRERCACPTGVLHSRNDCCGDDRRNDPRT